MFENPRRGRQARNFTKNVPKILDLKSSSEQIFSKIDVGCPWCVWTQGRDFSSLIFGRDDVIILHRQVVQCPLPLLIPSDYMNQKLCWPRPRLAYEAAPSHLPRTQLIPGKLKILRKYHLLNSIAWYWTCRIK